MQSWRARTARKRQRRPSTRLAPRGTLRHYVGERLGRRTAVARRGSHGRAGRARERHRIGQSRAPGLSPASVAARRGRAVVSLGGRPLLCPGSGRRSTRDLRAQVGGVPRLADRWLPDRPARAAVELGDSPRGRDARGQGAIYHAAFPRSSFASARTAMAATRRISSTWASPAAGPSRFAIKVGASSIGLACISAAPRGFCPCRCRLTMARSICCAVR